jgi:peptidoglycan-associated lipoprotein
MSKPWTHCLHAIAIICICFTAGCAGVGSEQGIDSTQGVEGRHRSSLILSAEKSIQQQLAERRASLTSLEYETNTFNNQSIFFGYDSFELTKESTRILAIKADILKRHPQHNVLIEGHCDEWGTIEYNLALGDRRASAARDYLIELGIEPERIQIISYGEERPVDPGHNEEAWAKNRRDRFHLLKP